MGEGTCFGYEVRSDLPFSYLRGGRGDSLTVSAGTVGPLEDEELLQEWCPPSVPFRASLLGNGRTYRLWVENTGWMGIDPANSSIVVPEHADPLRVEERLWGMPALLCFLDRGDVPLHAAAVEVDGCAVLVAAPGRFGKTTLLSALAGRGLRVLTEDLACVRTDAGASWVVPGPAMLRLRRDVADAVLPMGYQEVGRDDDRVHLAAVSDRGDCAPVPVHALLFLRENDGPPRLSAADPGASLPDLWQVSFHLARDGDRARCFRGLADVAGSVPLFDLWRRRELDDLPATMDQILELTGG